MMAFRIGIALLGLSAVLLAQPATALSLQGDMVQGGLIIGQTQPGNRVMLDGEVLKVTDSGHFVFGFDRDAPASARLEVDAPNGERQQRDLSISAREYDIQRIDGLPPAKVTPPDEVLDRIRRESAAIGAARRIDSERLDFFGQWVWPAAGRISGVFGSQRVLNGQPRRPHYGLDIAAPTGTAVYAPKAGKVVLAQSDNYYSGHTLILDHGHQLTSTYIHLHSMAVSVGDLVEQGQKIGEVGATGRVTGPHLDWRLNWRGRRMDPMLVMPSDTPPSL
jgi:biotin carboxyl carrier protein